MNGKELLKMVEDLHARYGDYVCLSLRFSQFKEDKKPKVYAGLYVAEKWHNNEMETPAEIRAAVERLLDAEPIEVTDVLSGEV